MKPPLIIVLLLVAVLTAVPPAASTEPVSSAEPAAGAAKAPTSPPLSPRFKQVRDRIDALFQRRNDTPPPPDARMNPFRAPRVVVDVPAPPGVAGARLLFKWRYPNGPSMMLRSCSRASRR
ncbi:MAG: hypothetical protein EXS38_09750 [Opitutus sp.]|nr:hypothetical protein [Opitutus sp.]